MPENPSEASLKYYEDAVGIVDKYSSTVMGNMDGVEQLGLEDLDYNDPGGAVNGFVDELNEEMFRSKVTSADSTAKELINTVNCWIADCVAAGGAEKTACELKIVLDNGKATVTDLSGKNDWEKRNGCPESLDERIESDYSKRTFTAGVITDKSGYAAYAWYVPNDPQYSGASPTAEDFASGFYSWGTDVDGLTSENVIMGTFPRLADSPVGLNER